MPHSPIAAQSAFSAATYAADSTQFPESGAHPHRSTAANPTPALSDMTLDNLLIAKRSQQYSSRQVWETLMSMNTTAGRELLDCCQIVSTVHPEELTFAMATLFSLPAQDRTLAKLDDAGIFIHRTHREHLSADDTALLLSDEGLQLWLRFAASPSAYPSVFVDSILNETSPCEPTAFAASALRVLVITGRDKTNNVAASEIPGNYHLPLAHLCSQVAPEWLPSLLKFGTDANQLTANGVPLVATAMAAQAQRIGLAGHDLLIPHPSLYELGTLLRSHGARLSQYAGAGSPPVMLLALNGYCAAAEALLAVGAACNSADGNTNGNTLMHYLAAATHLRQHSFASFFLLSAALRFGGDPEQRNGEGVTARSLLPEILSQYLEVSHKMIVLARAKAKRNITTFIQSPAPNAKRNVPQFVIAMATETGRLCARGHDPLLPHQSLFQLAMSFQQSGMDLGQRHPDGMPPVLWLTRQGCCGAAEVLLALNPTTNAPGREGNSLMHSLASATRANENAILADYMLTTALRYGGDPNQRNRAGDTALSFLSAERSRFVRAGFAYISGTRKSAHHMVANRLQIGTQPSDVPMRHSATPS